MRPALGELSAPVRLGLFGILLAAVLAGSFATGRVTGGGPHPTPSVTQAGTP